MGGVILKSLFNFVLAIFLFFLTKSYINSQYYLLFFLLIFLIIVVIPHLRNINEFNRQNSVLIENTLCSSCQHFDKTAVLCLKFDEHPTVDYLPCEGGCWEPNFNYQNIENVDEKE